MFEDRVSPERFRDDEVFGFAVVSPDTEPNWGSPDAFWLSERLVARLAALASAYELPLVARLIPHANSQARFGRAHCEAIPDELAILVRLVNDPLVHDAAAQLQCLAERVCRTSEPSELVAEAP